MKAKTIEKFRPVNKLSHQKTRSFTTLPNDILQNVHNMAALGMYCYLASKPDDWIICKEHLENHFQKGRDFINGCWKHLKEVGLLDVIATRDDKGHITGWTTILKDTPQIQNTENPSSGDNCTENTQPTRILKNHILDEPDSGETTPTKERDLLQKKETTTTKEQTKESSSFIISQQTDKELLEARQNHQDERSDEEFLKQCKHHLNNPNNKNNYTLEQRIVGLLRLIRENRFSPPAGYKVPSSVPKIDCPFTEDELNILATYKHAIKCGQPLTIYFTSAQKLEQAHNIFEKDKQLGGK